MQAHQSLPDQFVEYMPKQFVEYSQTIAYDIDQLLVIRDDEGKVVGTFTLVMLAEQPEDPVKVSVRKCESKEEAKVEE